MHLLLFISAAVIAYTGMFWVLALIIISHHFGRKKAALIAAANCGAAFVVLFYSNSATHVLIFQMLQGMAGAAQSTTSMMIVTEYSAPRYRGIFLAIKSACMFWGIWIANAIGTFCDYRNIAICGFVCSVYNLISLNIIPESPYWLAEKQRFDACSESYCWLNRNGRKGDQEIETVINLHKDFKSRRTVKKTIRDHISVSINNIIKPEIYKPILLTMIIIALYQCSGKFVCTVYSIQIIKNITDSESTAYIGMLILDGFTIFGMYIGCCMTKFMNRRTLLLATSIIGISFLFIMSAYLYLIKFSLISENNYVFIALLTGFSISISCGPMILSATIFAELTPVKSRSFSLSLVSILSKLVLGVLLQISPFIFKKIGYHGTFLYFAFASTICLVMAYKYLPETKDKTLLEISDLFKAKEISGTDIETTCLKRYDNKD